MSSSVVDQTAPPEWIADVCDRVSEALGCRFEFHPAENALARGPVSRAVWRKAVHTGDELAGHLCLTTLATECERELSRTIGAAEVVADLVARLATAERRLESRRRDVSTLMELGRALPQTSTLSATLDKLLAAAVDLTGFWSAAFFLADPLALSFQLRHSRGLPPTGLPHPRRQWADCPDGFAVRTGAVILHRHEPEAAAWLPAGFASGFAVPVCSSAGPLGTLWCFDRRQRPVQPHDLQALQSVAAQTATVLERAVWQRESVAQKRLKDELHQASQRHPGHAFGPVPKEWGLEIAVRTASAAELGGDLCELWPVGPRKLLVAIGDAVGHSVPAALIMAVARGSLRTLIAGRDESRFGIEEFVARLNQALYTVTRGEQFMTLYCGLLDLESMTLSATNAGHPQPWLIRKGDAAALGAHGLLLGIMPDTQYEAARIPLQPGDTLVFFTDGVSEAMSRTRELFRPQGVLMALKSHAWQTAEDAADIVWTALQQHQAPHRGKDDQTLLVVRLAKS